MHKRGNWYNDTCAGGAGPSTSRSHSTSTTSARMASQSALRSARDTQTFAIPFRPPANNTKCPPANYGGAGLWYDGTACHYGQAVNITFNVPDVQVPNDFIYGIAMNTSNYGADPYDVSNPAGDAACQAPGYNNDAGVPL